jgi:hypothetical protein
MSGEKSKREEKMDKCSTGQKRFLNFDTRTYLDLRPMTHHFMDTDFDPAIYAR